MMRALLVERPGTARVVELPVEGPGPGEVLVRVGAAGICGSDLELLDGTRAPGYVRYPIVPGHEWAGTVVEVGKDVRSVQKGDLLVAEGIRPCGECARCREGRTNLCDAEYAETGFTHPGAFADYVRVPARLVHVLPPGTDLSAAALLEPAACVANGLLDGALRPGLEIAVVGSGTLGLLAVAIARLASPARLVLVGTRDDRLALGRSLGATGTADARDSAAVEALAGSFDLVFEAASRLDGAATAVALARRGGTVILEGLPGDSSPSVSGEELALKHLTVQGIFGASSAAWQRVVGLFSAGLLDPRPLVTHRFALGEHEAAFATVRDRETQALKVELIP
jgi:threonine dehydrogenase-like Zn-dependent dehydrogenase